MTAATLEHRSGRLALGLQEVFTAAVRLRANRQVASDAESFRAHVKQLLGAADQEARRSGYPSGDVKLAIYAATVFVDESVLGSSQPMFAGWSGKPLQEEIFGDHRGGETFFEQLNELLARPDSEDLADLLEVYQLCLLLGFQGRYGLGERGQLPALILNISHKVDRGRRGSKELSPSWAPPTGEAMPATKDPMLRKLVFWAAGSFAGAVLLFVIFSFSLSAGIDAVRAIAP